MYEESSTLGISNRVDCANEMTSQPDQVTVTFTTLRDIDEDHLRSTSSDGTARPLVVGNGVQPARPRHILMRPRRRSMPTPTTVPPLASKQSDHALQSSSMSNSHQIPSVPVPAADVRKVRMLRRRTPRPRPLALKLRQPSPTGRPPSIALPATSLLVASASQMWVSQQNVDPFPHAQPAVLRIETSALPFKGKDGSGSYRSLAKMSATIRGTAKRNARAVKVKRIAQEFLESERAYVRVLDEIHDHFYVPLQHIDKVNRVLEGQPVFDQKTQKKIFSNFVGIRVLAKRILKTLECDAVEDAHLLNMPENSQQRVPFEQVHLNTVKSIRAFIPEQKFTPVNIGTKLGPMLPYLRIYNFFIADFDNCQAVLREADNSNSRWREFTAQTRKAKIGNGLNLSSMLLNIVQRIPRYRLLLQDLVRSTTQRDPDFAALSECLQIVEDVANRLQTYIRNAEASMVMLDINRKLQGLPFNLVEPGRRLIKAGTLIKSGRRANEDRAFFLFSDMLMYADAHHIWQPSLLSKPNTPKIANVATFALEIWPEVSQRRASRPASLAWSLAAFSQTSANEYIHKNSYSLCDVTATSAAGCSFYILTPTKSFLVVAGSIESKRAWVAAIRQAKLDFLGAQRSLAVPAITSTPTTVSVALSIDKPYEASGADYVHTKSPPPFAATRSPSKAANDMMKAPAYRNSSVTQIVPMTRSNSQISLATTSISSSTVSTKLGQLKMYDEYNAPVWTPDYKIASCKRCYAAFGLFLRKHHCRLCGDVVCCTCSTRRFAVPTADSSKEPTVLRACEDCYTVVLAGMKRLQAAI